MTRCSIFLSAFVLLWPTISDGHAGLPDPLSTDYLNVTETITLDVDFNLAVRPASDIHITGMSVVIDAADSGHNLHTPYHDFHHIRQYHVFAEEVVIRSPFHLLGTEVRIHARKVTFIDKAGDPRTYIRTTPLFNNSIPAQQVDGDNGLDAGDVYCFTEVLEMPASSIARFDLMGGGGQQPGPGRNGITGVSMSVCNSDCNFPAINSYPNGTVYLFDFNPSIGVIPIFGANAWPGNGTDAIPAGTPGTGGKGGNMLTNTNLSAVANLSGGLSAVKGPDYTGGNPGTPSPAHHVNINVSTGPPFVYTTVESRFTQAGVSVVSPDAATLFGNTGFYNQLVKSWFHPDILDAIIPYATDAALQDRDFTINLLGDYIVLTAEFKLTPGWNDLTPTEQDKVIQQEAEMLALLTSLQETAARHGLIYR
jgi:hypothetical protein